MMKQTKSSPSRISEISPYIKPICKLRIGQTGREYPIPQFIIEKHPGLAINLPRLDFGENRIDLTKVDDDIGHTLVHYLYTGIYQTLGQGDNAASDNVVEYRRAMQAVSTAKLYSIDGLADLASSRVELLGQDLSIFQKLDIASDIHSTLPPKDTWLAVHLEGQLAEAFRLNETIFLQQSYWDQFEKAPAFGKALARMTVNILYRRTSVSFGEGSELPEELVPVQRSPSRSSADLSGKLGVLNVAHKDVLTESALQWCNAPLNVQDHDPHHRSEQGDEGDEADQEGYVLAGQEYFDALKGRRITKEGHILDDDFRVIGKLVEGDAKKLHRLRAVCDGSGNAVRSGKVYGRVQPLAASE